MTVNCREKNDNIKMTLNAASFVVAHGSVCFAVCDALLVILNTLGCTRCSLTSFLALLQDLKTSILATASPANGRNRFCNEGQANQRNKYLRALNRGA